MLRTRLFLLAVVPFFMLAIAGCGGSVAPGVATGTDEPEPVLTQEEEANEKQSARDAASVE